MSDQFTIASKSGRIRAESDGQVVELYQFATNGETVATLAATVEDLRQVLGHILDTADEQLSERDLDRIAERVTQRLVEQREIVVALAAWRDEGYALCPMCGGELDHDAAPASFAHLPGCLVLRARALAPQATE
jgi:hypothetical protein